MPTPDASARSRGKFDLEQSGTVVVAGLDFGDKTEIELAFTNAFRDPAVLLSKTVGVRAVVTGFDFVDFADPTQGVDKAYVEVYRYVSPEGPYDSTSADITLNWVAVGGSGRDEE